MSARSDKKRLLVLATAERIMRERLAQADSKFKGGRIEEPEAIALFKTIPAVKDLLPRR